MTEKERQDQLRKLEQEIKSLQLAISMKDRGLARGVFSDRSMNWLCKDCPYSKSCERIRNATSSSSSSSFNQTTTERRLVEEIMQVISDRKTLDIFYSIAEGVGKNDLLKRTKGFTKKQ